MAHLASESSITQCYAGTHTVTLNTLAFSRARKQIDSIDEQMTVWAKTKNITSWRQSTQTAVHRCTQRRVCGLTSSSLRLSRSSELSEPAASIIFRLCSPCLPSPVEVQKHTESAQKKVQSMQTHEDRRSALNPFITLIEILPKTFKQP